jgi:hypothetical protein
LGQKLVEALYVLLMPAAATTTEKEGQQAADIT